MRYALLLPVLLAACGSPSMQRFLPSQPQDSGQAPEAIAAPIDLLPETPTETLDPTPPPPPPARARTQEQFDTTTREDRAEALDVQEDAGERLLGTEVAALGAPTDPGIWVKTSLVDALTPGRVEVVATGKDANIELRPGTGGTQISLAAMRLLDVSLTDLPELKLYAR